MLQGCEVRALIAAADPKNDPNMLLIHPYQVDTKQNRHLHDKNLIPKMIQK